MRVIKHICPSPVTNQLSTYTRSHTMNGDEDYDYLFKSNRILIIVIAVL